MQENSTHRQILECDKRPKNQCQKSPQMGFKRLKSIQLQGVAPPQPPTGALKWAPGPDAMMGEHSARYALQLFPFFPQQLSGISDENSHSCEPLTSVMLLWHGCHLGFRGRYLLYHDYLPLHAHIILNAVVWFKLYLVQPTECQWYMLTRG